MKNNKGFTLIELLVVVAIIGILAAVGTVAYTGYTANAKKSAAKSNHASVVKYIAAELQKCNMEEEEAMDGELTCDNRTTAQVVQTAAIEALKDFKNPFKTGDRAVSSSSTTVGFTKVTDNGAVVTIETCWAEVGGDDTTDPPTAAACAFGDTEGAANSSITNTVSIE